MSPGPMVKSVEKRWKNQMMDGNPCKVIRTENNQDVKNHMMDGNPYKVVCTENNQDVKSDPCKLILTLILFLTIISIPGGRQGALGYSRRQKEW